MYENVGTFLAALEPTALEDRARHILQQFKDKNPAVSSTRQALNRFFEREFGPTVICTRVFDYYRDLYLVPIKSDGVPPLDTATPPGVCRLQPVRLNPRLLPVASKVQERTLGLPPITEDIQAPTKDIKGATETSTEIFTFDTTGSEVTPEPAPVAAEDLPASRRCLIDQLSTSTRQEVRDFATQCFGTPIAATEPKLASANSDSKRRCIGYSDVCLQNRVTNDPLQELLESTNAARIVATADSLQPQILNEHKLRKQQQRDRKTNEIDGWFGMKRRKVTEDVRNEFKAIDLRGYVDPKKPFRTSGKPMTLTKAQDGFFQFGTVVGGHGDVKIGEHTPLTPPKRKPRSLVKSILGA
eukprot:Gregarina_sp_Poly_1__10977@NODE_867_length_5916_cov_55_659771_g627_i0_p3_GENE_NODE_867_length_5916_cov_55_659771_g627_i0NODE_867_length_5916_cov_55_659771_g627_i0_p3_ORF_typecomplete_len366_score48_22Fcf2/PF08698_11/6_1e13_NODE_867_length_5916_cov_55_659771_g627_i0321099